MNERPSPFDEVLAQQYNIGGINQNIPQVDERLLGVIGSEVHEIFVINLFKFIRNH